ncbi:hypothetical protein [Halalkalibacter krulwichiae]|uniref:Uncharacterized protein n=1 Tax=Halalkalibacter krulwichiae TaxID=199441 RepID=A0A1X9MI86_9BACI|nr:hypothetical protein [Halalkalibacter krulwichiae]ARK32444.1 hypothetical protein BkAM31D_22700 [Halalkalibacter krulwichiae]
MGKFIKVGKERVSVSEEIYREYYKMKRRERYMEEDIKVGRINVDVNTETIDFLPSKEDSINRLMDQGADFEGEQLVEDIICDKATLLILQVLTTVIKSLISTVSNSPKITDNSFKTRRYSEWRNYGQDWGIFYD